MTRKEMLLHIVKDNGVCTSIADSCDECPLSYDEDRCTAIKSFNKLIKPGKTDDDLHEIRKAIAVELYTDNYPDDMSELFEVLM